VHLLAKPRLRSAGELSEPAIDADVSDPDLEKFDVPFRRRKLGAAALEQAETAPRTPRCASRTSLHLQTERKLFPPGAGPSRHRPKARKSSPDAA
jgi:hypothetical protein